MQNQVVLDLSRLSLFCLSISSCESSSLGLGLDFWISANCSFRVKNLKSFLMSFAFLSAAMWCGYSSFIGLFSVSGVMEVSRASLLRTPDGIDLNHARVWALPKFRYLSSWFSFRWT